MRAAATGSGGARVELILDQDFEREIASSQERASAFRLALARDVSGSIGIPSERVRIIKVEAGSIKVTIEIAPAAGGEFEESADKCARMLAAQANEDISPLRHRLTRLVSARVLPPASASLGEQTSRGGGPPSSSGGGGASAGGEGDLVSAAAVAAPPPTSAITRQAQVLRRQVSAGQDDGGQEDELELMSPALIELRRKAAILELKRRVGRGTRGGSGRRGFLRWRSPQAGGVRGGFFWHSESGGEDGSGEEVAAEDVSEASRHMMRVLSDAPFGNDWLRVERHRRSLQRKPSHASAPAPPATAVAPFSNIVAPPPLPRPSGHEDVGYQGGGERLEMDDDVEMAIQMTRKLRSVSAALRREADHNDSPGLPPAPTEAPQVAAASSAPHPLISPLVSSALVSPISVGSFGIEGFLKLDSVGEDWMHVLGNSADGVTGDGKQGGRGSEAAVAEQDAGRRRRVKKGKAPFLKSWLRQKERERAEQRAEEQGERGAAQGIGGHPEAVGWRQISGQSSDAGIELSSHPAQTLYNQLVNLVGGKAESSGASVPSDSRSRAFGQPVPLAPPLADTRPASPAEQREAAPPAARPQRVASARWRPVRLSVLPDCRCSC